eukprot:COSAG02_NODE_11085_length_1795_cov_34.688090_1_plen_419_part_00
MTSVKQAVDTALTDTDVELLRWLRNNHDSIATVFGLEQRMSLKDFGSFMGSRGLSLAEAELASLSKLLDVDVDSSITRKELEAIVESGSLKYLRGHQVANALVKIVAFVFVALPIVCCTLAVIFGAILSVAEGWGLKECFYVVLMELSGTNIDLHTLCGETAAVAASCAQSTVGEAANAACNAVTALEDSTACQATGSSGDCIYTQAVAAEAEECAEHPEGPVGKIVAALIGVLSIAIFGAVLAVMGGPLLAPFVTLAKLEPREEDESPVQTATTKLLLLIFIGLPVFAIVIAAAFGGLLALLEDWPYESCFYAILAEVTACEIDLTDMDALVPEGDAGRLSAAMVGLWSMASFAAVVGVSSGSLVEPLIGAMKLAPKEPYRGQDEHGTGREDGNEPDQGDGEAIEVRKTAETSAPQP